MHSPETRYFSQAQPGLALELDDGDSERRRGLSHLATGDTCEVLVGHSADNDGGYEETDDAAQQGASQNVSRYHRTAANATASPAAVARTVGPAA
jgi:hypothetical protein